MALRGLNYSRSNGTVAYIGPSSTSSSSSGSSVSTRSRAIGPLPSYYPAYNTSRYTPPKPAFTYQIIPSKNRRSSTSSTSPISVDVKVYPSRGDSARPYRTLERETAVVLPKLSTSEDNSMSSMMSFFTQVAKITDSLFLCAAAAVTHTNIKQHGITHVINLTMDVPSINDPYVETTRVSVDDVPHANLGIYFDRITDKIRQVKERGGRTLVHCVAGVSRSSSMCIAYLMKYYRMPLIEAYRYVKGRRPVIRPNVGFFRQLIEYERKLFGKTTVRMVDSSMGLIPDVYKEETRGMVYLHPSPIAGSSRRGYNASSSSHFGR